MSWLLALGRRAKKLPLGRECGCVRVCAEEAPPGKGCVLEGRPYLDRQRPERAVVFGPVRDLVVPKPNLEQDVVVAIRSVVFRFWYRVSLREQREIIVSNIIV